MPLSKEGEIMKKRFEKEYGNRGDAVFYAFLNKHHEIAKKLERRSK